MDEITVIYQQQKSEHPPGVTPRFFFPDDAVAALINGELAPVETALWGDSTLEAVTLKDSWGQKVYRQTLVWVLEQLRRDLNLGPWELGPSWGGAYSFEVPEGRPLDPHELENLRQSLRIVIHENRPLRARWTSLSISRDRLGAPDDQGAQTWLDQKHPPETPLVRWGDRWAWAPQVLLPTTGFLTVWDLKTTTTGFVLVLPEKRFPLTLSSWRLSTNLYQAWADDRTWARTRSISKISDVNSQVARGSDLEALIHGAEAAHERRIASLADRAASEGARIIGVAGPSSSGKTTLAKRLAVQLQAIGLRPLVISLDDYFVDREKTPKDNYGHYDFEALEAVDRDRLAADLEGLIAGETVELPVFDFSAGTRKNRGRPYALGPGGILVFEGIHALNPELWRERPSKGLFRIFVSALNSLTTDSGARLSSSDHRLIRRIVRDHQFRGYSARQTMDQWPSVRRGEDRLIFPFQDQADAVFNSSLAYELSVLRDAAIPLLETVGPEQNFYPLARILRSLLESLHPIPVRLVPPFSILREFVGQSGFHY